MKKIPALIFTFVIFVLSACDPIAGAGNPSPGPLKTATPAQISTVDVSRFVELERIGRGTILGISLSPDEENVVVVSKGGVWIYSIASGELISQLEGIPDWGFHSSGNLEWSPDGTKLAIGRENNGVWILDARTWAVISERKGCGRGLCGGYAHGMTWSPDGDFLAVAETDGRISIWDSTNGTWSVVETSFEHHIGLTWTEAEGLLVFHQGLDSGLYQAESGELVMPLQNGVDGVGEAWWAPDYKNAYVIFDLGASVVNKQTNEFIYGVCCYVKFAWSQNGRYLATTSHWDQEDQSIVNVWDAVADQENIINTSADSISALTWNKNGDLFAAELSENSLWLWNLNTDERLLDLGEHIGKVLDRKTPLDDRFFIRPELPGLSDSCPTDPLDKFISPSGTRFAYLVGDNLRICSAETGKPLWDFDIDGNKIDTVLWSPNETHIIAALVRSGPNAGIFLLNLNGENEVIPLEINSLVSDLAFSPDGSIVAAAETDGTLKFWSIQTGELLQELQTPFPDYNLTINWSADGARLEVLGWDGIIRIYGMP